MAKVAGCWNAITLGVTTGSAALGLQTTRARFTSLLDIFKTLIDLCFD
jgi:hypothetical protein